MESLITALAPAFAVGLGLQAAIELFDRGFDMLANVTKDILPAKTSDDEEKTKRRKAFWIRLASIIIGVALAWLLKLHVLTNLGSVPQGFEWVDTFVAGLIVSLGTDGINQIIKFVEKAKNNQETQANS